MKNALENVMRIDYYGKYFKKRIVLFNKNKISEKEVHDAIVNGFSEDHRLMIDINEIQFNNVFC